MSKHPVQKIEIDSQGVTRFVQNKIVRFLLDAYRPGLNDLIVRFHADAEDYDQLMMLIGYSISGFEEINLISNRRCGQAKKRATRLLSKR